MQKNEREAPPIKPLSYRHFVREGVSLAEETGIVYTMESSAVLLAALVWSTAVSSMAEEHDLYLVQSLLCYSLVRLTVK